MPRLPVNGRAAPRWVLYFLAIASGLSDRSALAQGLGAPAAATYKVTSPTPSRVYQRERDGKAEIPLTIEAAKENPKATIKAARLFQSRPSANPGPGPEVAGVRLERDRLVGVPTGGPYRLQIDFTTGEPGQENLLRTLFVDSIFVGDLWVLAGQSNMEGYGDLLDVAPSHPRVMLLGMDGTWSQAREPLHWLVDSPDPVHSGDPATREARSAEQHKKRLKGAGLGLPFAAALTDATGVPIGLIACAHGGTSMAQWDPAKKDEGGKSLYGSMIRQLGLVGNQVRGVLWYQGESDANPEASKIFADTFAKFIEAVRTDLGQPDLPFYYVQIGRFIRSGDPGPWNLVQDAQRRLAEQLPNTAVISVIDLELDDLIHVGVQGLKRAGHRFARIAQREIFGQAGAATPTLDRVMKGPGSTLVVKFKGVNLSLTRGQGPAQGLTPQRHIAGFSIRKEDGSEIPLIYEAGVGKAPDTVVLKLVGPVPPKAVLWYGHGLDPYCNLVDAADMAVPVFGPIPLDDAK